MPGDSKECRENAKQCLELARTARSKIDRERFEGLAHRWLTLATDYEAVNTLLKIWRSADGSPTLCEETPGPDLSHAKPSAT